MGKKVIIISSSPRRNGNSEVLCDQFKKGAIESGYEVEKLNLNDFTIFPCLACQYCHQHDHVCVRTDDADNIIQKMIDADVWVLATPVYFYSMSAQLKLLIDRMYAREHEIKASLQRKKAYFIMTSGSPDHQKMIGTVESLRGFINVLQTIDEGGIIYGTGAFHRGDALHHPAYQEAYCLGKCLTLENIQSLYEC